MLKISLSDGRTQLRLVLEGKLIAPWAAELKSVCESARAGLDGRELIIDMKHVTAISQEGENVLVRLMKDGARFHCCDVFTKHIVKQLSRRASREVQEKK
jgi:anti-anti-sigma regulatory factor